MSQKRAAAGQAGNRVQACFFSRHPLLLIVSSSYPVHTRFALEMLSDVSSLTDISSEDESHLPVSKAKKGPGRRKEWQPKQVLKAPRLTQYSTATLYDEIMNGKVDLDPEYQRDVVWTDTKQSGLIDSILRNFYIPPVIFAFSQTEDGEERRTCIDGKQRLTSIQRFKDGQIPFKDSRTNLKLWYKLQPGNERGKLLPAQYRKQFDLKQISCVEYTDLDDDAEREIFQRVQLGVALTPAERMQAITGPWPQLVRDVLNVLDEYKINDALEWSKTRGRDFHSVASIIYLIEKDVAVYPHVSTLEKWLRRVTPPTKIFQERVSNVFMVFRQLVLLKKFATVFKKPTRVSPIEFVMVVVLIDAHYKDHTLTQLTDGIRLMRKDVRSKHDDIRANTKVTKTMLGFIRDKWPSNLKKEPGEKRALDECKSRPIPKPTEMGKRKRGDDSDSSGSESSGDEHPLKSKVKTLTNSGPSLSSKSAARSGGYVARDASWSPASKPDASTQAKPENASNPGTRHGSRSDRLEQLRRAKKRIGLSSVATQEPTPPPTTESTPSSRQTPTPQSSTVPQDAVSNNPNHVALPGMWPGQFGIQMTAPQILSQQGHGPSSYASQWPQQTFQPNMPPPGVGSMSQVTQPLSHPSPAPHRDAGTADPRSNPYLSGPPTPNYYSTTGAWISRNDPQQGTRPNYANQRGASVSSVPGLNGGTQGRDGRYDRPGGYQNDGPRHSPVDPHGRGQGSPGMKGHPYHQVSNDRDRELLGSHSGGISGREQDQDRRGSGAWSSQNGR